jgi:general secretion pathway protein C
VSFDALLKRYSVLMLLGLVAVAAYFQAAGTMRLFGAAIQPTNMGSVAAAAAIRNSITAVQVRKAEPILSRNAFDSVTGPLNATPITVPSAGPPVIDTSSPLSAPVCEGVRVLIVTESADPVWSVAALQGPGETTSKMRRVGDTVAGKQIAYIGFNPETASPAVWMTSGSALCQSPLFAIQPAVVASSQVAAGSSAAGPAATGADAARRGPPKVDPAIASKIQKISDTEFHLDRSVVDKILGDQSGLMKAARIVPDIQNGQTVGVRLYGIRPDTLLGTLGLQNADRLETINGFNMASPEKALEAYARLRSASGLKVQVNRRGQPVTIDYKIQ